MSLASDSIVKCAKGYKRLGVEQVYLCYALGLRYMEELKYNIVPKVEPKLAEQKRLLEAQGLETFVEIAPGIPSEEMDRIAEEKDVSLIVIGSHGESLAQHLLFKFGAIG